MEREAELVEVLDEGELAQLMEMLGKLQRKATELADRPR